MGKLRRAIAPSCLGPPILTMYHSPHRIEGPERVQERE